VLTNEVMEEDAEMEIMYQSMFNILISEWIASEQVHLDKFESAVLLTLASQGAEHKSTEGEIQVTTPKVTIEEIEDESWADLRRLPKTMHHILEETELKFMDEVKDPPGTSKPKVTMEEIEDEFWQEYYKLLKSPQHVLDDNWLAKETLKESLFTKTDQDGPHFEISPHQPPPAEPPPTNHAKPIQPLKKRFRPDGTSTVGVSVLAVRGWVGLKENNKIDLQLDSCADITLLSEEYYHML